jgi:hypothetical protein
MLNRRTAQRQTSRGKSRPAERRVRTVQVKIADKDTMLKAGGQVRFPTPPKASRKISKTICRTSVVNFVERPAMRTPYARRAGQVGELRENLKTRLIWEPS